jgi:hypothetical protein
LRAVSLDSVRNAGSLNASVRPISSVVIHTAFENERLERGGPAIPMLRSAVVERLGRKPRLDVRDWNAAKERRLLLRDQR